MTAHSTKDAVMSTELETDLCRSGWRPPWSVHPLCAEWRDDPWAPAVMHPSPPQQPVSHSGWNVPEEHSRVKVTGHLTASYGINQIRSNMRRWNIIDPCRGTVQQQAVYNVEKKHGKIWQTNTYDLCYVTKNIQYMQYEWVKTIKTTGWFQQQCL